MKVLKVPALVRDSVRPMCADTPLHTLSESLSELSLHICLSDLVECGVGVRVVSVPALQAQREVQTSTLLINCPCHCRFKRKEQL